MKAAVLPMAPHLRRGRPVPSLLRGLTWVLIVTGALACESHQYVTYELRLVSATRQMLAAAGPAGDPVWLWFARSAHKDEYIVSAWTVEPSYLMLELSNKSLEDVRIDWAGARFIDEAGQEHELSLMGEGGGATVIAPGGRWSGRLYPRDYEYEPGRIQPLLPSAPGDRHASRFAGEAQALLKLAGQTVGKSVVVDLPVSVGAAAMIYRFEFDIRDFELHRETGAAE